MQKILLLLLCFTFLSEISHAESQRGGNWRWRADDGDLTTATWLAPEVTTLVSNTTDIVRLRWEIYDNNSQFAAGGTGTSTNTYQLRVGLLTDGTNNQIPVTTTSSPFRLVDSPNLTDEEEILGDLLTDCESWLNRIIPGNVIESNGNRTMVFSRGFNDVLENEWVLEANGAVIGETYLFKLRGIAPGSNFDWSPDDDSPNGPTCAGGGATWTYDMPAPVTYLDFRGQEMTEGVKIMWATEVEENNSHFELRRSDDRGRTFHAIATIEGNGTTELQKEYDFLDIGFVRGAANYYQLRQVDFDGQYEDSNIIIVNTKGEVDVIVGEIFPNPSDPGILYLDVYTANDQLVNYTIYDQLGRSILTESTRLESGDQRLQFDTSSLPAGNYYARISNGISLNRSLKFTIR
ncbi:MAG: T9SS type A sorting domain-containing protein [Bacteroidota bacterium]